MIPEAYRPTLENTMDKLPFVSWDRFTLTDGEYQVYGWIDREQDLYKDFVLLSFTFHSDDTVTTWFTTSSSARSMDIHKLLGMDEGKHSDCLRVEDYFDVSFAIKL